MQTIGTLIKWRNQSNNKCYTLICMLLENEKTCMHRIELRVKIAQM